VVDKLSTEYSVRRVCDLLKVSFSSFYAWRRQETYILSEKKVKVGEAVKKVFDAHYRRYGARRIVAELRDNGVEIGRYQTRSAMKAQNLKAIQPKSFVPKTTDSKHKLGRSPNLLLDRPSPSRPNEVFVGDITYIPLRNQEFIYLATFQDMYSRKIVGWELLDTLHTKLIMSALQKAIHRRKLPKGLIVHSDGGRQYGAHQFKQLLRAHDFLSSMTRKDNHYDNAMAESFFSRFKAELLEKGCFETFEDAYTEIFEYLEIYYNRKRRHSGIQYDIPERFEEKYWEKFNVE
jgi:putative transposase